MQVLSEIADIPIRQRGVSYRVALPPPGDNRLVTFADRLKERRNQYGLSQREISAVIGIDQSQYSRYEKGTVPTQEVLKKISDLLECSIDFLLGATDDPGVIREFENLPEDEKNLVLIYRAYKRGMKIPRAGIKMLRDLDLFDENTGLLIEGPKKATPPGQEEAPDRKVI